MEVDNTVPSDGLRYVAFIDRKRISVRNPSTHKEIYEFCTSVPFAKWIVSSASCGTSGGDYLALASPSKIQVWRRSSSKKPYEEYCSIRLGQSLRTLQQVGAILLDPLNNLHYFDCINKTVYVVHLK